MWLEVACRCYLRRSGEHTFRFMIACNRMVYHELTFGDVF